MQPPPGAAGAPLSTWRSLAALGLETEAWSDVRVEGLAGGLCMPQPPQSVPLYEAQRCGCLAWLWTRGSKVSCLPALVFGGQAPSTCSPGSRALLPSVGLSGHLFLPSQCPLDLGEQGLGEDRLSWSLTGPSLARPEVLLPPLPGPPGLSLSRTWGLSRSGCAMLGCASSVGAARTCPGLPRPWLRS